MRAMDCPCGSGAALDACCGPTIDGEKKAETAEALMRSRYTAYATGKVEHVFATHDPETRDEIDERSARQWSEKSTWHGLEIVDTKDGGPNDDTGEVEFIARYELKGEEHAHRERSTFRRVDGDWYFEGGTVRPMGQAVRDQPKIGRNEPCPCGSGKKYKKCCGSRARA
jgi:SEC-C motif-containing protein